MRSRAIALDLALVKGRALEVQGVLCEVENGHDALGLVEVRVTRGDARRAELDKIELFQKEIEKCT